MYENPISKITSDIQQQIIRDDENNLLHQVRQSVGYFVDKEELIKALNYDRDQYQKGYHDGLNADKWIPVSERLPEENKTVMVSTDYGVVYPEARYTKEYGWEWHCDPIEDRWATLVYVTAWMPLPDPYKPPKSEKEENEVEENLKPCPFCGSENVKVYNKYGSDEFVKCNNCGVRTAADSRERVIELWNTRYSQESDGMG